MMTLQEAIAKATKLLKLSESSNPHEAALAAQRAQEILTRYDIDQASLSAQQGNDGPEEDIQDFSNRAPLDQGNARMSRWKAVLASRVASANQCKAYKQGSMLGIIGRASDVEKVRYLYEMLVREVDRLADRDGKGCGKNWRTEYRYGVVEAIAQKLSEAKAKVVSDMRAENNGQALVLVNQAIEKIDAKNRALDAWVSENMRMRSSKVYTRANYSARQAGREAGQSINLSGARAALGAGQKQIKK